MFKANIILNILASMVWFFNYTVINSSLYFAIAVLHIIIAAACMYADIKDSK
jgi:hypothetical protein